ncbi:hypothetical protein GCM10009721_39310 [Terrabacter tumescens]|uniref:Uncharacterized protein n=1 Tax=Terrabacter tumescens TaxID=60443 RepID=A0ABQ2IG41_9MICO|nr:hypothetical protein [Terrabacter tumescens]GGN07831.1 hypothetical protein GCM10009721_39310 [Terrabacter tumescens]
MTGSVWKRCADPRRAKKGSSHPVDPRSELTLNEQVGYYVEMWKESVEVQRHFNDIEWRIRGLALTVATFALGAAGVAAKDGTKVTGVSLGSVVVLIGLLLWYAFYFVDRFWYHPLLKAAVTHGTAIENEIKKTLPGAGMTASITAGSVQKPGKFVKLFSGKSEMHSDDKLVWFYKVGGFALFAAAVALQVGVLVGGTTATPAAPGLNKPTSTGTTTTTEPSRGGGTGAGTPAGKPSTNGGTRAGTPTATPTVSATT